MKYFLGIFIILFVVSLAGASSPETRWRGTPQTIGDWFNPANWSEGVPTDEHDAYIQNSGIASIASGDAFAEDIYIGRPVRYYSPGMEPFFNSSGIGALVQTGGTLSIQSSVSLSGQMDTPGTYTLIGGTLIAASIQVCDGFGSGLFTQIDGKRIAFSEGVR